MKILVVESATTQPILTWGDLCVDPSNLTVTYGTHLLAVTPKEYAILELFLRNPKTILSAGAILKQAWNPLEAPSEEAVRVHIKAIRHKLKAMSAPKDLIETVYQTGYRLNPLYSPVFTHPVEQQTPIPHIAELTSVNQELRAVREQLQSTQAELRQKNQELERAHQTIAQERQQVKIAHAELELPVAERIRIMSDAATEACINLSDRKQPEIELQEISHALSHAVEGISRLDEQGHYMFVNDAYARMVGHMPESMIGMDWQITVHPDDLESAVAAYQQMLSKGDVEIEIRGLRKDGSVFDKHLFMTAAYDKQQRLSGHYCFMKDVSERKQAEAALQQQLKQAQLVAEITQSIRQTLELDQILQQTVDQVRQFLQTDRVIILCFQTQWQGLVVAESVAPGWTAILSNQIHDSCFSDRYIETYRQGRISMITDLETSGCTPCHAMFLSSFQVKANLVIPILQKNREQYQLWGLLISHHCTSSRQWKLEETELLKQLANQLSIAIQQSELYEQTRRELRERRRAEAELRSSEARYRLLFESNPNPIWVFDVDTLEFLAVNRATSQHYGYSREEFLSMTLADICPPEDIPILYQAQLAIASNQNYFGVWRHLQKDGSLIDVEILVNTFIFAGKQASLMLVTNITERLQAERKIREQAALLDIASDAIFVRDLEHHILYWNQGAEHLYGWQAAEALGQKATELLQDDADWISEIMQILLAQGEWQGELHEVTQVGKKVIVEGRWTLVRNEADQPKCILAVNTDITEKKHLELQFYHAQRLESLGTLASGIAHDLNNVLTPILAIAQLMRLTQTTPDVRSQKQLHIIEESARRGANMVKQILTFAQGTEGQPIMLRVAPLLQEVVKVIQQTFLKSIQIRQSIPDQSLWIVSADPTHLHQVFMNLCVNARDAMLKGGVLTLSAENYYVDDSFAQMNLDAQVGNYVLTTIADTGVGIPPELRDRIFDPFFTTKAVGHGTGLGLSIALGIVKNYGGFLQVSSEVGKGTQVKVYLPVVEGTSTESRPTEELIQGKGELVLIVDDDVAIQRTNQSLLENHHYKTLIANNGIDAIALYTKHQDEIKAVLMDIIMPNMDGITAVWTLHKINPQIKIIAISGLSSNREPVLSAGANVFLPKPYTIEDLLRNLHALVNYPTHKGMR
jgi:PAS domain S-box-containing protein